MNEAQRREIGNLVIDARTSRGWSKERLADEAGITTTTLRRIEEGLRVQDAKLRLVLDALKIMLLPGPSDAERWAEEQMSPAYFLLPPDLERGYQQAVAFTHAVTQHAPELAPRATRLMVDAARLFGDAADSILNQQEGGDGNADASAGGSAPSQVPASGPAKQPDEEHYELAADEPEHTIAAEQEGDEFP